MDSFLNLVFTVILHVSAPISAGLLCWIGYMIYVDKWPTTIFGQSVTAVIGAASVLALYLLYRYYRGLFEKERIMI